MICANCGLPVANKAAACSACDVVSDPAALAALAETPEFKRARAHKPKTNWPWLVPFYVILSAGLTAGAVFATNLAGQVALSGLALLCAGLAVYAIRKLLRPPRAHAGTLVFVGTDTYTNSQGRTVVRQAFGLELAGEGRRRFAAHTCIQAGTLTYGDSVIAFVDETNVYEIWTATGRPLPTGM